METLDQIIERGQFTIINLGYMTTSMGYKEEYSTKWVARSWTPRQESAEGATLKEAVDELCRKLEMR